MSHPNEEDLHTTDEDQLFPEKPKQKVKIEDLANESIQEYPPRERSGYVDYRLGKVSVTWRGGEEYRCGTCQWPDNFQAPANGERPAHRGCAHIKRIVKYREEHAA